MEKTLEREFLDLPSEEIDALLHSLTRQSFEEIGEVPNCSEDGCEIVNEMLDTSEPEIQKDILDEIERDNEILLDKLYEEMRNLGFIQEYFQKQLSEINEKRNNLIPNIVELHKLIRNGKEAK